MRQRGGSLEAMRDVDFLVVGGGIAGLRAAAGLAGSGSVLIVTKERLAESNTAYAQGGIAVAMGGAEDVELHLADTIVAGDGLVNAQAAEMLVQQGPRRVDELLRWGTSFDRYSSDDADAGRAGKLMKTREGAHTLPRILHAGGDATGREISMSLLRHVRTLDQVELMEWIITVDLIVAEGRVVGATLLDREGVVFQVRARAVLLASGGAGQLYSQTTNPAVATGDGIAMAYRAGAELMDMEFYQFHPTAFALDGAPRFLMSEALRGEGAWLVDERGERFMGRYHPGLELAPRDAVARAIVRETADGTVYLDMREAGKTRDLKTRFPGISEFLAGFGLELGRDRIPVRPAAHYLMGGIRTNAQGRTSLAGLYAAGEAACTGVHGANRLASNSLLEGLVFGALAAEAMAAEKRSAGSSQSATKAADSTHSVTPQESAQDHDTEGWIAAVQRLMWREVGVLRDDAGLRRARVELASMGAAVGAAGPRGVTRRAVEAKNLHMLAEVTVQAALAREESRGAHFRTDFPAKASEVRHSVVERGRLWFVN
jgi:L-aspartate oxidase